MPGQPGVLVYSGGFGVRYGKVAVSPAGWPNLSTDGVRRTPVLLFWWPCGAQYWPFGCGKARPLLGYGICGDGVMVQNGLDLPQGTPIHGPS
jgi:hypothetical protein